MALCSRLSDRNTKRVYGYIWNNTANIMSYPKRFHLFLLSSLFIGFCLINNGTATTVSLEPRINIAELQSFKSYDALHELAVLDQIDHFKPAYKSLETRQVHNLDGLASFCLDDLQQGFRERWFERDLRQTCRKGNYYRLPIPAAFNDITSNATVRNYVGFFWYQFEFSLDSPVSLSQKSQLNWSRILQFESVNYLAFVFGQPVRLSDSQSDNLCRRQQVTGDTSNYSIGQGKLLGSHVGGHLPFAIDVTKLISNAYDLARGDERSRSRQSFRISVAISNLLTEETIPSGKLDDLSELAGRKLTNFVPDFDFFHYAGIMGSVNLLTVPPSHWTLVEMVTPPTAWCNSSGLQFEACLSSQSNDRLNNLNNDISNELDFFQMLQSKQQLTPLVGQRHRRIDARLLAETTNPKDNQQVDWLRGQVGKGSRANCFDIYFPDATIDFDDVNNGDDDRLHNNYRIVQFNLIEEDPAESSNNNNTSSLTFVDTYELRLYSTPSARRSIGTLGKPLQMLQGFGMHHEQLFSGRSMGEASILKDLYLLKELGANVLRTSHYPYSRAYLQACNELGLLVVAEAPAVGLKSFSSKKLQLHKQILLEMMQRDHEHVSIFAWSLANEPQSQLDESQAYFKSLVNYAKTNLSRYTDGRLVTAAIAQSPKADKIGHLLDMVMLNYYYAWYDWPGLLAIIEKQLVSSVGEWARRLAGKPLLISEFGVDTVSGFHSLQGEIFSEEYQRDYLLEHERIFDKLWQSSGQNNNSNQDVSAINFWGSMAWNFADFDTHASLMRPGGNRKGLFDRSRRPKLAYSALREAYRNRLANSN